MGYSVKGQVIQVLSTIITSAKTVMATMLGPSSSPSSERRSSWRSKSSGRSLDSDSSRSSGSRWTPVKSSSPALPNRCQSAVFRLFRSSDGSSLRPEFRGTHLRFILDYPEFHLAASGYEDWASSPNSNTNNNGNNGTTNAINVVSSPDGRPSVHPHYQQSASPWTADIPHLTQNCPSGGSELVSPHGSHLNPQLNSGQVILSFTPIPHGRMAGNCNAVGPTSTGSNVTSTVVGAGHHSPDSGLAGSDGLSSAGSPAQHQHPGILGSNGNNPLMNNMNNSGSNSVQAGQPSANGSNSNLNMNNMTTIQVFSAFWPQCWSKKEGRFKVRRNQRHRA
jgi:hypothetical protein